MRLATITNWAYGATVALTLVSGATMVLASNAQTRERAAVEQRYALNKATSRLNTDIYALTDHARQYLNTGDPTYRIVYLREYADLGSVENRITHIGDAGASGSELDILQRAVHWADTLHDEQREALAAFAQGDEARARRILFGAEYERELDKVSGLIASFQEVLERRTEGAVRDAAQIASLWKTLSEILLAITGLLFLFVIYFIFRKRVLHPVVKLSDVVNRLADQDYAAQLPEISQIDEIGDMAQAIRVFRENGLQRQRLEAERDADRFIRDVLSSMTQRMQSCDTLDDLQKVVQRFVPEIMPGRAGRLYMLDNKRNAVVEACSWLDPQHTLEEFPPSACWALRRGLPHRPTNGAIDVPCQHIVADSPDLPDTLCLPLTAQRETLGLLYFEARADYLEQLLTPEIYLDMLAENIGLALANLHLREALREMAMVDPLTGLANRRWLGSVLESQLAQWTCQDQALSCLMIDVDHFKRINDVHGHDAGDAVLREMGALLKNATREPELAFRYGGEEFLLLLPGIGPVQAAARAEEIRARMGALRIAHSGVALEPISVSAGIASTPDHCPADRLVRTADAALLRAKSSGRDRIEVAQERQFPDRQVASRS